MNRPERILRLENVHKRYGDQEVLRGVSLELARGDIKVIIGPSGSGKSTLLHCINFLVGFEQGRVWLHDQEIDPDGRGHGPLPPRHGLRRSIVARLVQRHDQRTDGRGPDLSEGIGRTAPDNPVLVLEAADQGLDEGLA